MSADRPCVSKLPLALFTFIILLNSPSCALDQRLTANQVAARIQSHVGIPWMVGTVDTFKAGDPGTQVTGIAVTMMATLDVLQRAAASGKNLVITHEPTFFNHLDAPDSLPQKENDTVLAAKRAFIALPFLICRKVFFLHKIHGREFEDADWYAPQCRTLGPRASDQIADLDVFPQHFYRIEFKQMDGKSIESRTSY
jgi:NIF3 (NGG1p interacting factor 3) protein